MTLPFRGVLLDVEGPTTALSFVLDVLFPYAAARLDCKGYVHAHPPGYDTLSYGDFSAVRAIFGSDKNGTLQQFFMPIITGRQLRPYVVLRCDLDAGRDIAHVVQLILF